MIAEKYESSSIDVILSGLTTPHNHNDELLKESLRVLKPKGVLVLHEPLDKGDETNFSTQIAKVKLNGFLLQNEEPKAITSADGKHICKVVVEKPHYEVNYTFN